jgi:hypothetical protein
MSDDHQTSKDEWTAAVRLSVYPEPTDDELLAIVEALKLLADSRGVDDHEASPDRSAWEQTAIEQGLRSRTWIHQARSWTNPRW